MARKRHTPDEEIEADLDAFMAWYNSERTNQGRYCQGRTPTDLFRRLGALLEVCL